MEEIELKLRNQTPFTRLSQALPELKVYRWCSSMIDYMEIYGRDNDLDRALEILQDLASDLGSEMVLNIKKKESLTVAIKCRCSLDNSTIRIAESMNLLWEAPAIYSDGYERLKIISFNQEDIAKFFERSSKEGNANIIKKRKINPDSLRELYTISLADIFGELSEKQLKFLRDAIAMGLFSTPRKIMVEDLARMHRVTKSTMQEHINKARNKLIQAMEPYLNLYSHSREG